MIDNKKIVDLVSSALNYDFGEVLILDRDAVTVEKCERKLTVGGASVPQKMRALTLAYINKEKKEFNLRQEAAFEGLGVMLDVSRGGVMRTERVKEFILRLAMTGSNKFMLYTEDTYTLEDYPYFGYCRGRYSDEELTEIIEFGEDLGVELIPCIQTLGHMEQYLSWKFGEGGSQKLRDTKDCLLCDSEDTYTFIEAEIKKMKSLFKSKKIHIGMDEAVDMGLGKYLKSFGYTDQTELFKAHLIRVTEICRKYGLEPIMWSDMFFRLAASDGEYYNTDTEFSPEALSGLPDVDLVYWDYYNKSKSVYDRMIEKHTELKKPIVFAGASISFWGLLPAVGESFKCTEPALKSCVEHGIKDVFATMWGDDGCEIDHFDSLYAYAMFSEMCYNPDYTMSDIENMGMAISGYTPKLASEADTYYSCYPSTRESLFWCDIFYKLTNIDTASDKAYLRAKEASEACSDEYVKLILKIFSTKAEIYANMQTDYKAGLDMREYSEKILPELLGDYERLYELFSEKWLKTYKVFGFENLQLRFNAAIGRIKYAIKVISEFSEGRKDRIEELEYEPMHTAKRAAFHNNLVSGCIAYG